MRKAVPRFTLAALLLGTVACQAPEPVARPNIVLVTVDTLRADGLGCYGNERLTSPQIDSLAADGVLFERALSQAPWTLPSMVTVHTGLYPSEHVAIGPTAPIPSSVPTLAEELSAAGWHTIGAVSHLFTGSKYGFDRGFDKFDESVYKWSGHDGVSSPLLTRTALDLFAAAPADAPVFLWVHYFDPHFSYVQHPEFGFSDGYRGRMSGLLLDSDLLEKAKGLANEEDVAFVRAVYEEEIALTDMWIGRLVAGVRTLSERPTVVVLTADHGEYFMERGRFGHGRDVYQPLVHVPLIISGAIEESMHGRRFDAPVGIDNVSRTVLNIAGVEGKRFPGVDLVAIASGATEPPPVFTEGSFPWGTTERKLAVVDDRFKLIFNHDDGSHELYDLLADPAELTNLIDQESSADVVRGLQDELSEFRERALERAESVDLTDAERERLRSLGYVQ